MEHSALVPSLLFQSQSSFHPESYHGAKIMHMWTSTTKSKIAWYVSFWRVLWYTVSLLYEIEIPPSFVDSTNQMERALLTFIGLFLVSIGKKKLAVDDARHIIT